MHYPDLSSFPWIVSSGTLKTEDLLVSFWQTLESLSSSDSFSFDLSPSVLSSLEKLVGEDSKEEDYKEGEASELLLSLFELLEEASPSGFYFGSNPGDGALFGFWLSEDWESALQDCDFFSEDPALGSSVIEAAEGFGVCPDTFSDCFQGEVAAYTEAEAEAEAAKEILSESEVFHTRFLDLLDFGKVWHHFYSSDFALAKSAQSARYFLFNLSNV
jgi:hypothetical protein